MNLKLLVFLLLISVGNLGQAAKPSSVAVLPKLPNTIGGFKVLASFPPGTTACTRPTATRIVLQTTETNAHAFLKSGQANSMQQVVSQLRALGITDYQITIADPKAAAEGILRYNASWNSIMGDAECRKLSPEADGFDGQEVGDRPSGTQGRAIFEDTDVGSYPSGDDYATGQDATLTSPSSIDSDNDTSAFVNNVKTSTGYFIQNGFWFDGITGLVIWTIDYWWNYPQPIDDIPYVADHDYQFIISAGVGGWWVCQYDTSDINTYRCIFDDQADGSFMIAGINTSVWFENFNTNDNWYDGFGTLKIQDPHIYINGFNQEWDTQHRHTTHACGQNSYPTSTAMSGSLITGSAETAYFYPEYLPLRC